MKPVSLEVVWPTRSRTGSQFVLALTTAVRGAARLKPQSRISGARQEGFHPDQKVGDFHEMFAEGRGGEHLAKNDIRALKFEDPGKDDFVLDLLEMAPHAVFVASHRRIENVIESHFNIKKWGHKEADVLHQFSACAHLYEQLAAAGRFFLVDVDRPDTFNPTAFARFLGVDELPAHAAEFISKWEPTNDLRSQVQRTSVYVGRESAPRIDRLRDIHPWIDDVEARYAELVRRSAV